MNSIWKRQFAIIIILASIFIGFSCNEIVNEMPPSVIPHVSSIESNFAIISWNNVGNQYTYSVGLASDSLATLNSAFDTLFTSIVDTTYSINNLQSATKYWVRVITVAGENKPDNVSNVVSFTTK